MRSFLFIAAALLTAAQASATSQEPILTCDSIDGVVTVTVGPEFNGSSGWPENRPITYNPVSITTKLGTASLEGIRNEGTGSFALITGGQGQGSIDQFDSANALRFSQGSLPIAELFTKEQLDEYNGNSRTPSPNYVVKLNCRNGK